MEDGTMATRLREHPTISVHEMAVARVDDALRGFAQRELVTPDEARGSLGRIAETIDDPVRAARAMSIVEDGAASWADSLLVGGTQVMDALLDLRLVITD
jgi:hypothetical protein